MKVLCSVKGTHQIGVRGMIDEDGQDEVVGDMHQKHPVSGNNYGCIDKDSSKRSDIEDYLRHHNRGRCKRWKTMKVDKNGKLVTTKSVTDENDLMIINKSGITIRLKVAAMSACISWDVSTRCASNQLGET